MNKIILNIAISNVKSMCCPMDGLCDICRKKIAEIPAEYQIEIKGMMTEIGVSICKTCLDNILIEIGIISAEY